MTFFPQSARTPGIAPQQGGGSMFDPYLAQMAALQKPAPPPEKKSGIAKAAMPIGLALAGLATGGIAPALIGAAGGLAYNREDGQRSRELRAAADAARNDAVNDLYRAGTDRINARVRDVGGDLYSMDGSPDALVSRELQRARTDGERSADAAGLTGDARIDTILRGDLGGNSSQVIGQKAAADRNLAMVRGEYDLQGRRITGDYGLRTARTNQEGQNFRHTTQSADNAADNAGGGEWGKPFEVADSDGNPVLVQADNRGNLRPVEGFAPKEREPKPLTEAQTKSLVFAQRGNQAADILDRLEEDGVQPGGFARSAAKFPGGNFVIDNNTQQYLQAERQFIESYLRKDSGAAISAGEYDNARQAYFPQAGDSPEVIQQKRAARRNVINSLLLGVPDSALPETPQSRPQDKSVSDMSDAELMELING